MADAWDDSSVDDSPKKTWSSSPERSAPRSSPPQPGAEQRPLTVPTIVLLPPSAPESEEEEEEDEEPEEEDNCETTETELDKDDKDAGGGDVTRPGGPGLGKPDSLDELPPPPEIPPFCLDCELDLPSPPAVTMDLISFGDEGGEGTGQGSHHVECSCEKAASALHPAAPDSMSRKSSHNSLLFDLPDSELIGRPAPIVLTMDKGGPVRSAQVVKPITQPPPTAPKPAPSPLPLVGSTIRSAPGSGLEPQNIMGVRPRSACDVTVQPADRSLKPGATPWSISADTGLDGTCHVTEPVQDDFSDFPPPPPPLEVALFGEEDSPWVPLMQRFQLLSDTRANARDSGSPPTHRKSKGKMRMSGAQRGAGTKARAAAPASKASFVEMRPRGELREAKSETRV